MSKRCFWKSFFICKKKGVYYYFYVGVKNDELIWLKGPIFQKNALLDKYTGHMFAIEWLIAGG